jgi:hypothetical protein
MAHEGPKKIPKIILSGDASPPTCANVTRAGDGNRTRTISLGIRPIRAPDRSDLGTRCTISDRDGPCDTGANGPPMARGLSLLWALAVAGLRGGLRPHFSNVPSLGTPSVCSAPSGALVNGIYDP